MPNYVVNNRAQSNGDHEVHHTSCSYLPISYSDLGYHTTCAPAVAKAKTIYRQSNGCKYCSPACHTT